MEGIIFLYNKKKLENVAFVWFARYRRYFISNTLSLKPSMPYTRDRLRQVYDSPNVDSVRVEFEINQPRVAEIYYSRNSYIEECNRTRLDDLQLEKKLQTKYWSIRVNTSILGMNDVDNYYLGKACKWWGDRNPVELY